MVTVEWQGIQEMTARLQRLAAQAGPALLAAVDAEARRILEASYQLVPVDEEVLVQTGEVEAMPDGATIRYGGHGLAPYALVQHEDTTFRHPRGGQHHYLSQPFFAATSDMSQRLAADILPHLRGI